MHSGFNLIAPFLAKKGIRPQNTEDPEATCDDGIDNDCDTLVDADDPDCDEPPAVCSDYLDQGSCEADPDCRWNKKKGCVNR